MDKQWLSQLPISNITKLVRVGGGDVNNAYRLEAGDETYFLLTQPHQPATFYAGEIAGLKDFEKNDILAPRVLGNGQIDGDAYLLLNYLEQGQGSQTDLGELVAKLHHVHSKNGQFGYDLGYVSNDESFDNSWTDSWSDLFVNRRLDKLRQMVLDKHLWTQRDDDKYQQVRQVILAALAEHQSEPSLLHGDLWGGNYMFLADGQPALIDPAAFYGDREFDLGITTVFGGFDADFYAAYNAAYPLDPGANQRLNFYRLYYLMVHTNKFGSMYKSGADAAMNQILENARV
ncbi:fructosamine kinase family protein [Lentilactobacillus sp. G22-6]|uniref:fructosamine kinase family protein n=1 Tax=Lentilactobacillus dabitei TaxID=2831523 RepID=UPI001C25816F|nr:fructosamine kinase family protein [Lentilactobacillus dabitei]MBU9789987.1 fructosamine kinase family protein [Lentilactobacillus dabitei]